MDSNLRDRREAIVRQHIDAENRHDVDGTVASFHHPCYDVVALGEVGRADGATAVRDLLAGLFAGFPDFHVESGPLLHADSAVFVEVRNTGTHHGEFAGIPPTGRSIELRTACLFEFDGDRLIREKVYFDLATILRQLGVLET